MYILLKFDSLDKMTIKSSESKVKLEMSGKGLITSLDFKVKVRPQNCKKAVYAIRNVSKKDLSNVVREFEKFERLPYEKKRPKHKPTDIYLYLARQLARCMMRDDTLNWNEYGGYMKMSALSSNVCSTNEDESKRIIVHGTLSRNCSTEESESKCSIINENLSQSCSTDKDE